MSFIKKMTVKQRIICALIPFGIAFILLTFHLCFNDSARFKRFTEKMFLSELSGNTLNLHYTIAYPENYHISEKASLPVYHFDPSQSDNKELISALDTLNSISRERLDTQDAFTYDLLTRHLHLQLKGQQFSYYSEPFSPNSGIQSGLPILLADYTFRRKQDVEDYLDILDQSKIYLESLLEYETEKAQSGLFMSDTSAQKVIEQCSVIMNRTLLEEGSHFLHVTFNERIDGLLQKNLITTEEADAYRSENDRLLTTVMIPAYEQIADTFTLLMGKGTNDYGLCYYPEGKSYYEYLLAYTTASNRSVPEIKQLLFTDFKQNYVSLITLLQAHPEIAKKHMSTSFELPLKTPETMLSDLKGKMANDFPSLTDYVKASAIIKSISPSMQEYCSPAYYLTPPIDDMAENIIYINPKNNMDTLNLYTTLAHEGYPGHLYQTVYSQHHMNETDTPHIRHLLHYGGYVEGWAYYVEDLSYEYAKDYATGNTSAAAYYEACRLNRNLHIGMYSLLDIAIHYDGATPGQIQQMLASIGITDGNTVMRIYEYIREEPCNYLKYYLGFLEMKALKEKAASLWGRDFSLYHFHKFVLETGPSDFNGLHDILPSYSPDNLRPKEES